MSKKNIVVVGGGSAGANVVRALSRSLNTAEYQLILINPLPYRIWLIGTLRAVVSPEFQKEIMVPYDKVFVDGKGTFVQGVVASFEASKEGGGSVTLEYFLFSSASYHILVLSQGATWSGPPAYPRDDNGVKEHLKGLHDMISKAKDIVLVGGGAVGFGESHYMRYHPSTPYTRHHLFRTGWRDQRLWPRTFPTPKPRHSHSPINPTQDKKVTIVHGEKQLFNPAYPNKMRVAAEASMRKRSIELILGDYVDYAETGPVEGITTRSGKSLRSADLVIQTRGPRPNTQFVAASLGADALSDRDLIRVRPTLQLVGHDSIYAAGDVIEWKEQKQAAKSSGHGQLVAANILAQLGGRALKDYKGATEMIVATNGKGGGVSYLDFLWGLMFGDWFARMIKSKNMLVPMFKGEQGY